MDILVATKCCTKCKEEKSLEDFSVRTYRKGQQRASQCKACVAENTAKSRENNPEQARAAIMNARAKKPELYREIGRKAHLKRKFNMTIEDYDELARSQNFKCAICQKKLELNASNRHPCVDHCHTTNEIRGILCWECNRGLGAFKDNIDSLICAINYLKRGG